MTRLVFGVMSAIHPPAIVSQMCDALAPHRVVIHHDYKQQADFVVDRPNASFVPDPKPTGWDDFAFSEGLFHLLNYCLNKTDFDYFQLLSPTCLPVRPVTQFESFVDAGQADAHVDGIDLLADDQAMVNFGHRTFAPGDSRRKRLLFRSSTAYFQGRASNEMRAGLQQRVCTPSPSGVMADVALWLNRLAATGKLCNHIFSKDYRPYIGSTWFGANRQVCEFLHQQFCDPRIAGYFRKLVFADEVMLSTLAHNSQFDIAPANHLICEFNDARPGVFEMDDLARIEHSGKFFARKFSVDPDNPVRKALLKRVRG